VLAAGSVHVGAPSPSGLPRSSNAPSCLAVLFLAAARFPPFDPLPSLSRVLDGIVSPSHRDAAARLRAAIALFESKRDLVTLGAYKKGSDPKLDQVLSRIDAIESFLRQRRDETSPMAQTVAQLGKLV